MREKLRASILISVEGETLALSRRLRRETGTIYPTQLLDMDSRRNAYTIGFTFEPGLYIGNHCYEQAIGWMLYLTLVRFSALDMSTLSLV